MKSCNNHFCRVLNISPRSQNWVYQKRIKNPSGEFEFRIYWFPYFWAGPINLPSLLLGCLIYEWPCVQLSREFLWSSLFHGRRPFPLFLRVLFLHGFSQLDQTINFTNSGWLSLAFVFLTLPPCVGGGAVSVISGAVGFASLSLIYLTLEISIKLRNIYIESVDCFSFLVILNLVPPYILLSFIA